MATKPIVTALAAAAVIAACSSAPPPAPVEAPPPPSVAADSRPAAASAEPAPATAVTPAASAAVTGNVTYRVRKALPPEALIRVELQELTAAGQPARLLGEQTIEAKGRQVPFAYKVAYDPKAISPKGRYQVSATITVNQTPWFVTEGAPRVITGGNPKRRDIVVKPAKQP